MAILSRTVPARLWEVEDETHADLFDGIVVAIRAEGIQPAVAELRHAPVHDGKQLDVQAGQPFILKVVVESNVAAWRVE
jgi:hypothetical protein